MEKIKGIIENVETSTGTGKRGAWKRFCFTIDGKKYSTFDDKIGTNYVKGMDVVMEGEQKGEFWNMKTMMPNSDNSEEYAKHGLVFNGKIENIEQPKPTSAASSFAQDRELNITAMSMVKSAADIAGHGEGVDLIEMTKVCVRAFKVAKEELNNG